VHLLYTLLGVPIVLKYDTLLYYWSYLGEITVLLLLKCLSGYYQNQLLSFTNSNVQLYWTHNQSQHVINSVSDIPVF